MIDILHIFPRPERAPFGVIFARVVTNRYYDLFAPRVFSFFLIGNWKLSDSNKEDLSRTYIDIIAEKTNSTSISLSNRKKILLCRCVIFVWLCRRNGEELQSLTYLNRIMLCFIILVFRSHGRSSKRHKTLLFKSFHPCG